MMERLTDKHWRNFDPWEMCGLGNDCKRSCVQSGEWCKVALKLRRLAAYEDTGLSPAEVAELAQAKKEGRVVVLPCAVRDTVYVDKRILVEGWRTEGVTAKIAVGKVVSFRKNGNGVFLKIRFTLSSMEGSIPYMRSYAVSAIGKTIFLTRKEAEKALREM